jgi:DNA-directed RNA polymerase subunit alpha
MLRFPAIVIVKHTHFCASDFLNLSFSAISAPLRELKELSRSGAAHLANIIPVDILCVLAFALGAFPKDLPICPGNSGESHEMGVNTVTDVRALVLESPEFGPRESDILREILANDSTAVTKLREVAGILHDKARHASGAEAERLKMRLGVVEYLLGRTAYAVEHLRAAGNQGMGLYYLGKTLEARGEFEAAATAYERAGSHGYDATLAALHRAGCLRAAGHRDQAASILKGLEAQASKTAEYHYQMGRLKANTGETEAATRHYEQALDIDPQHAEALFHSAFLNDIYGNDDEAIQFYERCMGRAPVHVGAVFNLGTLYEDRGLFDRAARCFQRVLSIYPTHQRARLFLKDCRASQQMYFDEDAERGRDRLTQLLNTPVTDFELSVRSRNCLRKMNIRSLGDLVRTTETDLLNSKNFGETSLQEIKELLAAKGLRVGMFAEEAGAARFGVEPEEMTAQERAAMTKPITDLNLSVRARKCMAKLGISTIGELIRHTPDQLLEVKNFGVTSLTEIRAKLGENGLKLQGD